MKIEGGHACFDCRGMPRNPAFHIWDTPHRSRRLYVCVAPAVKLKAILYGDKRKSILPPKSGNACKIVAGQSMRIALPGSRQQLVREAGSHTLLGEINRRRFRVNVFSDCL